MSYSLIDVFTKRLANPDFIDGYIAHYVLAEPGFKAYALKGSGIPYLIRLESEIGGENVVSLTAFTTLLYLTSEAEKLDSLLDIYRSITSDDNDSFGLMQQLGKESLCLLLPRSNWFAEKGLSFNDDDKIVGKDGLEVDDPVVKQFQEALDHLRSLTSV